MNYHESKSNSRLAEASTQTSYFYDRFGPYFVSVINILINRWISLVNMIIDFSLLMHSILPTQNYLKCEIRRRHVSQENSIMSSISFSFLCVILQSNHVWCTRRVRDIRSVDRNIIFVGPGLRRQSYQIVDICMTKCLQCNQMLRAE